MTQQFSVLSVHHTSSILRLMGAESIDSCKVYFHNDLSKDDRRLVKTLKEDVFCLE